jgi:hypothetical protein
MTAMTAMAHVRRPVPASALVDNLAPAVLLGAPPGAGVLVAVCPLAADFESVGAGRSFARRTAHAWRLGALIDDAELVTTELVSNALRHGLGLRPPRGGRSVPGGSDRRRPHSAAHRYAEVRGGSPVELTLLASGGRFLCAVTDPSDVGPVRRTPDLATASGRGLHLIDALSTEWGWTALRSDGRSAGKAVWAALSVDVAPAVAARAV